MGIPLDVIKIARKTIGQEFYWNSRDQWPRLYTNAYNEGQRREQRYASLDQERMNTVQSPMMMRKSGRASVEMGTSPERPGSVVSVRSKNSNKKAKPKN